VSSLSKFMNAGGATSVAGEDKPIFGRVFRNVAIAGALAVSAFAASAGTGVGLAAMAGQNLSAGGGQCAAGSSFMQAKTSGSQAGMAASASQLTEAIVTGLRVYQNANEDQMPGIDKLTNKAADAAGTKGESAARDAFSAAKQASFLTSVYKAAGTAQAMHGGDSAAQVVGYFTACNGASDQAQPILAKMATDLGSVTAEPSLKNSQAAAIKSMNAQGPAAQAGINMLKVNTDLSHEGEVLKPIPAVVKVFQNANQGGTAPAPGK
jgi:hypothetical protein